MFVVYWDFLIIAILLQNRHTNGQQVHKKVLSIIDHQGNANQIHSETSSPLLWIKTSDLPEVPSQCLSMWWRGDSRTWPFWQDLVNQFSIYSSCLGWWRICLQQLRPSCPLPAFLPQGSDQHRHLMPFLTHTCFLLLPVPDGHHHPFSKISGILLPLISL